MSYTLNKQQSKAVKLAKDWYKNQTSYKQNFEISGPPGTGKSTIVSVLVEELGLVKEEVIFCAFIGKAAQNLAMKGNNAKTIHSVIYDIEQVPKLNADGSILLVNDKPVMTRRFVKKNTLDENVKLIVLDEGGSVNEELGYDLMSFGIPIIVLGDIDQLPPVFGKCPFLIKPDIILTEFMRQDGDSEIVWMFKKALKGEKIPFGRHGDSYVIRPNEVTPEMLKAMDMIITGKNKTRDMINETYRKHILGATKDNPILMGEKIVCRKNNWDLKTDVNGMDIYLINGLVGYVDDINMSSLAKSVMEIDFRPDFADFDLFSNISLDLEYLMTPCGEEYKGFSYSNLFQYAYSISAHLSQGSQYGKVMYYKDGYSKMPFQLSKDYVGLSRATEINILVQED